MAPVVLNPNHEIVIPREICDTLELRPGQEFQVFRIGKRIEIVPIPTIDELHGMCPGIDSTVDRTDEWV